MNQHRKCREDRDTETVLEVKNLNRGKVLKDVNFELKKGEILALRVWLVRGAQKQPERFLVLTRLIRVK